MLYRRKMNLIEVLQSRNNEASRSHLGHKQFNPETATKGSDIFLGGKAIIKKTRIVVRQDLGLLGLHACFCQVFNKLVRVKSKSTAHQGFLSSYFSFDISIFKMKSKIYLLILVLPSSHAHADIGTDLAEFWQDPGGTSKTTPGTSFSGQCEGDFTFGNLRTRNPTRNSAHLVFLQIIDYI